MTRRHHIFLLAPTIINEQRFAMAGSPTANRYAASVVREFDPLVKTVM